MNSYSLIDIHEVKLNPKQRIINTEIDESNQSIYDEEANFEDEDTEKIPHFYVYKVTITLALILISILLALIIPGVSTVWSIIGSVICPGF